MNSSKIEQAIDEIYRYLDECKQSKIYPGKIMVDKGEMMDLLDELRLSAPDEIKRYQKIITNRNDILNDAQQRAENMVSQAQEKTARMLDNNEIMQTAYQRAEEIMRQANDEAEALITQAAGESDQMRRSAMIYTNDLLNDVKSQIQGAIKESEATFNAYQSTLKDRVSIISSNQAELAGELGEKISGDSTMTDKNTVSQDDTDKELKPVQQSVDKPLEPEKTKTEKLEI